MRTARSTSTKLSKQDRAEVKLFQEFLVQWNSSKIDTLSNPKWQKYMGLTPLEAKAMVEALQWVGRPGKLTSCDDPNKCPVCQGMAEIDCPRCS